MAKLLHIEASPRGKRSSSIIVAEHFIEAYRAAHPGDTVETLDLWHTALPEFDGPTIDAKYAIFHGDTHTPEQHAAWNKVVAIADQFKSADKFLFSLPMWNFGIPYKLKHFIDVLFQPGLTFSYGEKGYQGLVTGKPAAIVYARGGAYGPGSGAEGYDQQSGYLRQALGFIGITDLKEIFVEPTASPKKDEATAAAKKQAGEVAAAF